jgi:hypothetical protein
VGGKVKAEVELYRLNRSKSHPNKLDYLYDMSPPATPPDHTHKRSRRHSEWSRIEEYA